LPYYCNLNFTASVLSCDKVFLSIFLVFVYRLLCIFNIVDTKLYFNSDVLIIFLYIEC